MAVLRLQHFRMALSALHWWYNFHENVFDFNYYSKQKCRRERERERAVLDSRDSKSIQFQRIYSPIKSNRGKNGAATIDAFRLYLQRSGFRVTEIVTVSSSDRKRVRTRTRGGCLSFRDRRRRAQRRVVTRQHELRNCPPIERLALTRETKRKRKRKKEWGRGEGLHEIYTYDKPDGLLTRQPPEPWHLAKYPLASDNRVQLTNIHATMYFSYIRIYNFRLCRSRLCLFVTRDATNLQRWRNDVQSRDRVFETTNSTNYEKSRNLFPTRSCTITWHHARIVKTTLTERITL